MSPSRCLFTSLRSDWRTPVALYVELDAEFHFDFDPCPVKPKVDGLAVEWGESSFVNPPYGRQIGKWIAKAHEEARKGKGVVLLVPARTDTSWWHDHILQADEIRFLRGRLRFDDKGGRATFPSAVVVFYREGAERR